MDTREENRRDELAGFLQSRRARLQPSDLGLVTVGRRRVAGLRREETAQLAGVSVDYYIRLEQGRAGRPSEEVLAAIARALRLAPDEEDHLFSLARPRPSALQPARREEVRAEILSLLRSLHELPAFVINGRMDLLAWNELAGALVIDCATVLPARDNVARMIFVDPIARDYYLDWDEVAREATGHIRLAAARDPADSNFVELVDELSAASASFSKLWQAHDVQQKAHGTKRIRHPLVGEITVWYETLTLPTDADQTLVTYAVEPGSPSEAALRHLQATVVMKNRRIEGQHSTV